MGDNHFGLTVSMGVAAIKGTYAGEVRLSDLDEPHSLTLRAAGSGAPGTIDTTVAVHLTDLGDGSTRLDYDADAVVGGMVGGVGQRVLTSVARKTRGRILCRDRRCAHRPAPGRTRRRDRARPARGVAAGRGHRDSPDPAGRHRPPVRRDPGRGRCPGCGTGRDGPDGRRSAGRPAARYRRPDRLTVGPMARTKRSGIGGIASRIRPCQRAPRHQKSPHRHSNFPLSAQVRVQMADSAIGHGANPAQNGHRAWWRMPAANREIGGGGGSA